MKNNYADENIFILAVLFFLMSCICLISICKLEYKEYKVITGIVHDNDKIKLFLDKSDSRLIQQNKYIYLDGKKEKYLVLAINRDVFKKESKKYNEVIIEIQLDKKIVVGEYINLSIFEHNRRIYNIFKNIWKERK